MFFCQIALLVFFLLVSLIIDSTILPWINSVCLVAILLFGIPHGAIDHKIHLSINKTTSLKRFILTYLLVAGAYVVWWLLHPATAFWFFLILSSYHFGQETFESYQLPSRWFDRILTGFFILIGTLLFHYQETMEFVNAIQAGLLPELGEMAITSAFVLSAIYGMYLLIQGFRYPENQKNYSRLLLFGAMYVLINLTYGLLFSFTIYFIFFHSINAFTHQYQWLKSQSKKYDFKKFLIDLSGFSLISIFGIVLILLFLDLKNMSKLTTYFFILVSIITLPHAITFDRFYNKKGQIS